MLTITTLVLTAASLPVQAQSADGSDAAEALPVVKCDAAANSCDSEAPGYALPQLGAAGRATVLRPNLRSTAVALESADSGVMIPGCEPSAPGIFLCQSLYEYQHCRTLMFSSMVHSCRAGNPFAGDFAEPRAAAPGEYELTVDSNARVRVTHGERGFGRMRGDADVVLRLDPPRDLEGAWCLQRNRMLFAPTGPDGGVAEVEDATDCALPIEFSFQPHEDDVLRAFDTCETFAAWGEEIEDSMDIVAAGLFHMRSASPEFMARYGSSTAIIAPYVSVEAPLTIDCRD